MAQKYKVEHLEGEGPRGERRLGKLSSNGNANNPLSVHGPVESRPNFQCHITLVQCVGMSVIPGFTDEESKGQRDGWDGSGSAFQMGVGGCHS